MSESKRVDDLKALRRTLHRHPDLAGEEENTARIVETFLHEFEPDELLTGLGGHGLAAVFKGAEAGPTVLVRADLDALPIEESIDIQHASKREGVSHKCGHDGHMAMVAGLAASLRKNPPARGRVTLLFQPSEETGEGAARVLADPGFKTLQPDLVYGLHNLPGFPLGSVILRKGVFASASVGLVVELKGATAHAAEPEKGRTPALALAELINQISAAPQLAIGLEEAAKATVIHARLGEVAFGTTPGEAVLMATLRTHRGETLETLKNWCVEQARSTAETHGLEVKISEREPFPETAGDDREVNRLAGVAEKLGMQVIEPEFPFAWSEDFGHFTHSFRGVFFGLGAGERTPALHHPKYDFPDELLEIGTNLWDALVRDTLEQRVS